MQKYKKYKTDVLLAAALLVGGIFVAMATMGTGTSVGWIPSAYADANCEEADLEFNDKGHIRGNPKQCAFVSNSEGEQPRPCGSPNAFKDTDEDGSTYCTHRG